MRFSTNKFRNIYSLKFNSFFHPTIDSEGTPIIYDPNLNFKIYKKEAEIYKNYYISVKTDININENEKYILTYTGRKLTLIKSSRGFLIRKQIGTENVYKINVGEMHKVYNFPVVNDTRKFSKKNPEYVKCMQELKEMKKQAGEKILNYNNLIKKLNGELEEFKDSGPDSISKLKAAIEHIKLEYGKNKEEIDKKKILQVEKDRQIEILEKKKEGK